MSSIPRCFLPLVFCKKDNSKHAICKQANKEYKNKHTHTYKCFVKLCKDVFFHSLVLVFCKKKKAIMQSAKANKKYKNQTNIKCQRSMCSRSQPRTKCVWFVGQTQTQTQTHTEIRTCQYRYHKLQERSWTVRFFEISP